MSFPFKEFITFTHALITPKFPFSFSCEIDGGYVKKLMLAPPLFTLFTAGDADK